MRAATYHGQRDVRVGDVDAPAGPEANELRVSVTACGICGSDLHEYAAGPLAVPDDHPHPLTGETLPIPLGHEFSGKVAEVGADVSDVSVGDPVTVNPLLYCGECQHCAAGHYNWCESGGFIGLSGAGGGLAEEVVVPREKAVRLPDEVPTEYGALAEPFSVGFHAVRTAPLAPGDSVAVYGAGPIGLTTIQAAHVAGADTVYAVEPRDTRRELAGTVGADETLDPTGTDTVAHIHERTGGGVDVSFEAAGVAQTLQNAVTATTAGGHTTVISQFEGAVEVDPNVFVAGERSLDGTLAYEGGPRSDEEFGPVVELFASGALDPEALVSSRIALEHVVEDGFEALLDPDREEVKVLVEL